MIDKTKLDSQDKQPPRTLQELIIRYDLDNINKVQEYSTKETKVGKWIDGKTIYRKVFVINSLIDFKTGINVDTMIKMECLLKQTSYGDWRNLTWLYTMNNTIQSGSWTGGFFYSKSSTEICFQVGSDLANIEKAIIIMEYTK